MSASSTATKASLPTECGCTGSCRSPTDPHSHCCPCRDVHVVRAVDCDRLSPRRCLTLQERVPDDVAAGVELGDISVVFRRSNTAVPAWGPPSLDAAPRDWVYADHVAYPSASIATPRSLVDSCRRRGTSATVLAPRRPGCGCSGDRRHRRGPRSFTARPYGESMQLSQEPETPHEVRTAPSRCTSGCSRSRSQVTIDVVL